MNPIIEFLKQTEGTVSVDKTGKLKALKLLPSLTHQELVSFETTLPCPLPEEMRELLLFSRGIEGGCLSAGPSICNRNP